MPGKMVGRSLAPVLVLCLSLFLASDIAAQTSPANSGDPISASNVDEEASQDNRGAGGFGGYLPSAIQPPSSKGPSRLIDTAQSLKEKFGSVLKNKFSGKQNPSRVPTSLANDRSDTLRQLQRGNVELGPPVGTASRIGREAEVFGVRMASMQEPADAQRDFVAPLNVQFADNTESLTELPLESPVGERIAELPSQWRSDAVNDNLPAVNGRVPSKLDDAPLPPAWQNQDQSAEPTPKLELSSPLNDVPAQVQDPNNENDLRQNREDQLIDGLEGDMELRLLDNERFDLQGESLRDQSCAAFRHKLLDNPISGISLNISPPGSSRSPTGLKRVWTNQYGEVLASGTLVDLSRGYAVIQTEEGEKRLAVARLNDADWAAIAEQWRIPVDCSVGGSRPSARQWQPQSFTWTASSLCHKPLYFENVQLERYGHSAGPVLQPLQSTVHFFRSYVTLPFRMALNPPQECQYALGYYRPGNCAPWLVQPIPFNVFDKCFYQPSQPQWSW